MSKQAIVTRLEKLRQALNKNDLDAMLITRPENQRYLSGFTGGEAALLITQVQALLLTDFRYFEQVAEEAPLFELVKLQGKFGQVLKEQVKKHGIARLGFESTHLPFSEYQAWRQATRGTKWLPITSITEDMRMIKDKQELASMRKAVAIADQASEYIRGFIQPGMTEKQIAWELEMYMRNHGAEGVSFPFIVGSGPNGAKAHAVPQARPVREGEPIVLDTGVRVDGYCSDLTRTICLGQPDDKLRQVYDIVLRAQIAAEKGAKPGMQGKEIDAIARKLIADAGYAEAFGHGLGHGVGLAIHEKPVGGPKSDDVMQPGMVLTIEPGIYIPGWGGVRIEDMVLFTERGVQVLTRAAKELCAR